MPPDGTAWLNTLRQVVGRLHVLVSALNGETDPYILIVTKLHVCLTLADLRKLFEVLPGPELEREAMTATLKAHRLVKDAPWPRDSETAGLTFQISETETLPITQQLQEYAASIDPRYLENIIHLLSIEPSVVQKPATLAPLRDGGGPALGAAAARVELVTRYLENVLHLPPADADPVPRDDRLGESELRADLLPGLEWLNSVRCVVETIYALIFGLDDEARDGTDTLRTKEACNALYELRLLQTNPPEPVFMGRTDIALRKVAKLVEHAPWPREGTARPDPPTFAFERNERLPMTKAIMKYVERIKARELDDILRLLADVPPQVPTTATAAPTSQATGVAATSPAPAAVHTPAEIDFKAIAAALRMTGRGRPTQARLVEYMADKEQAAEEDIAEHVHDDEETSTSAIHNNVKRTNRFLETIESRLRFHFRSGIVYREISPE